jgi:hypothetical protein
LSSKIAERSAVVVASCLLLLTPARARADDVESCVNAASQGQAARRSMTLLDARDHFIACARDACPKVIRSDCAKWLEDLETRIPTVSVRVTTDDGRDIAANVSVDGRPAQGQSAGQSMQVDPGSHTFRAVAKDLEAAEQIVILAEGEKARVVTMVLRSKPPPATSPPRPRQPDEGTPRGPSPIVYGVGGLGIVALGSFAFFGLSGRADANELRDGCGRTSSCRQDDVDAAATKYLVADVSLAIGVVALGVATVLWLTTSR